MQAKQTAPKRFPAHRKRFFCPFLASLIFGVMTGNIIRYVCQYKGFYEPGFKPPKLPFIL